MSGAHEGCSQGKSVRDREGSKHSTAATPERVDSEAAVLPQDFEDTVHARQLKALCRRVGRRMSRQGPGRSPSMGLTHLNAARPREKSSGVPHCGSSKILSDLVSHRRATRPSRVTVRLFTVVVKTLSLTVTVADNAYDQPNYPMRVPLYRRAFTFVPCVYLCTMRLPLYHVERLPSYCRAICSSTR